MRLRRSMMVLFLFAAAAVGGPALAQTAGDPAPPPARSEARAAFESAVRLYDRGEFADAAVEFKRAFRLQPHYSVQFNLGLTFLALDQLPEAADALERYIDEGGAGIPDERRQAVTRELDALHRKLAVVELKVEPNGGTLLIDGLAVAWRGARHLHLAPGAHRLTISLDEHQPWERPVELQAGERLVVSAVLLPSSSVTFVDRPAPDVYAPVERSARVSLWVGGAGLVCLAGAGALYLWNDARHDRWAAQDELLKRPYEGWQSDLVKNNELIASIKRVDLITYIAAGAGIAALGTASLLYVRERSRTWTVGAAGGRGGVDLSFRGTW